MRWVNDTLPPRARDRWLLMTMRLSQRSFTGTARTEVAVGTDSESSMLAAVRAGAPRSTVYVGWSTAAVGSGALVSLGTGAVVPLAGSAAAESGRGVAFGAALASASAALSGLASEGLLGAGSALRAASFAGADLVSVGFAAGVAGAGLVVVLAAG